MPKGRKPKFNEETAARIKRHYKESNRSMAEVARIWGCTPGTVDRIVMGKYTPLEEWELRLERKKPTPRLAGKCK